MTSVVLLSVELERREQITWKEVGADTRGGLGGRVRSWSSAEVNTGMDCLTARLCAPHDVLLLGG